MFFCYLLFVIRVDPNLIDRNENEGMRERNTVCSLDFMFLPTDEQAKYLSEKKYTKWCFINKVREEHDQIINRFGTGATRLATILMSTTRTCINRYSLPTSVQWQFSGIPAFFVCQKMSELESFSSDNEPDATLALRHSLVKPPAPRHLLLQAPRRFLLGPVPPLSPRLRRAGGGPQRQPLKVTLAKVCSKSR